MGRYTHPLVADCGGVVVTGCVLLAGCVVHGHYAVRGAVDPVDPGLAPTRLAGRDPVLYNTEAGQARRLTGKPCFSLTGIPCFSLTGIPCFDSHR